MMLRLVFVLLFAFSSSAQQVHIVSTTDLHGRLAGIDTMAGYFDIARQADPDTLFLDSGDMFQGTIISNSHQGAAVVKWMNYVGYTAAAVGNHEFDFGPGKSGQDLLGALKRNIAAAHFKFLAANIYDVDESSEHPVSWAHPYLIREVHGLKLGIIGLTTTLTPSVTMPKNVARLRFMPLAQTLEHYVAELQAQNVNGIVVIAHEGNDAISKVIDELRPETRQAISLILAGHTHNFVNTTYQNIRVLITGSYGRAFGYTSLDFDFMTRKFKIQQADTIYFDSHGSFLGKTVQPNPEASQMLAQDIREANALASTVVGKLLSPLNKTQEGESNLGDFMTDAFRLCPDSSCQGTADIAFLNNGGIRSSQIPAGPVTYGQVFEVMPFDNIYTEVLLSGRQVHDLLDAWYSYPGDSPTPQVSGLAITYNRSATKTRLMTNNLGETKTLLDPVESIKLSNGQDLSETAVYRVVLSDFLATGGGGTEFVLKDLSPKPEFHDERKVRDQLLDYFRSNPAGWDYRSIGQRIQLTE